MRKIQGMSFVGMLLTMTAVIVIGILLMRAVPVYLEYYSVISSIDALKRLPATDFSGEPSANAIVLKGKLVNQLYVNSITLPVENIKVAPKGQNNFLVSVKYQVIKPLVANASLLFDFDVSEEVAISAQ